VFFHAHPDDETLLTGGTMARLAAEGNRVVLVVATAGERGLTDDRVSPGETLGEVRMCELQAGAAVLGCARVVGLGYADSGSDEIRPVPGTFAAADVGDVAARLAALLRDENAELLTIYDPRGGYGHPDHVQVHRVGAAAARLAGTPCLLEATLDRDRLLRGVRLVSRLPGVRFDVGRLAGSYTRGDEITHRVDVRDFAAVKRHALAAHASQRTGGRDLRTLEVLLRLPLPVFRWALGAEWFVDRAMPAGHRSTHPFAPR
jgi:LmbE family N-acetylglucosaminyl deacetylase